MQAVEGRRRQMIDFRSGLQRLAPCAIPSLYSFLSPTQDTKISRMADILKLQVPYGSMRNMLRDSNMKDDLIQSLRPQSASENLIKRFQLMVPVPSRKPPNFKVASKHCKNCESCPTQVTWKINFKCPSCLSCPSCPSCLLSNQVVTIYGSTYVIGTESLG